MKLPIFGFPLDGVAPYKCEDQGRLRGTFLQQIGVAEPTSHYHRGVAVELRPSADESSHPQIALNPRSFCIKSSDTTEKPCLCERSCLSITSSKSCLEIRRIRLGFQKTALIEECAETMLCLVDIKRSFGIVSSPRGKLRVGYEHAEP